jgi:eukaryotic-like serine/threonine-protein kinase
VEKRFMRSSEPSTARTRTLATRHLSSRSPPAPVVLERYRLQRRLGAGAFGTVWLARDERLERDVAVKILPRERTTCSPGRFEREARAAARLSHPAIVTLYEAAVDDEGAYLVSELVRGDTLDSLLAQGQLSDRDIIAIGLVLCDALEHAHGQGVVHRDVKPSNVLVPEAPPTSSQLAKLTDFGVARVVGGDALTGTGDVLGTLAYMAPEQAEGLEAGEPADLYSLALVLYEALSGINPVASSRSGRHSRRLGLYVPPLRRQRRDLPRQLAASIDLALRPRPRERGTVAELRRALALAHDEVGDEPGVVTGAFTTLRPGPEEDPAAAAERERLWRDPAPGHEPGHAPGREPGHAPGREPGHAPGHEPERALSGEPGAGPDYAWPPRALGAVAAAALTVWLVTGALAPSPVGPAAAGLLAGAAVLLLPRLGWGALILALAGLAASRHLPGAAAVITLGLLLPLLVTPAAATTWPLGAGAPALGLVGLAGAWPAVAARAGTAWRRAALGAIGWIWLLLASAIAGKSLYLPLVSGVPAPHAWMSSLSTTVTHLLEPEVSAGVLAPALIWAFGAVTLPWLVRGVAPVLDFIRVIMWAAIVVSATGGAIVAVHGSDSAGAAPSALVGAVAAVAVALVPSLLGMWRVALRSGGPAARVP